MANDGIRMYIYISGRESINEFQILGHSKSESSIAPLVTHCSNG